MASSAEARFVGPVFLAGHAHAVLSRSRQRPCPRRHAVHVVGGGFLSPLAAESDGLQCLRCARGNGNGHARRQLSPTSDYVSVGGGDVTLTAPSPAGPYSASNPNPLSYARPGNWLMLARPAETGPHRLSGDVQLVPRGGRRHDRRSIGRSPQPTSRWPGPIGCLPQATARKPMPACSTTWWRSTSAPFSWKGHRSGASKETISDER